MGAEYFHCVAEGKDAHRAFANAVEEAYYWHGHGGYTGSIAEKLSFVLFAPQSAFEVDYDHPEAYALVFAYNEEDIVRMRETLESPVYVPSRNDDWKHRIIEADRRLRAAFTAKQMKMIRERAMGDKWDAAACIPFGPDTYLFFGFASC